jgi:hypothetical protein
MRIWDIPPEKLCTKHLFGEHRELHAIWNIITKNKKGYAHHPETMRWRGKLLALYRRHEEEVREIQRRGFRHNSPLEEALATGSGTQDEYLLGIEDQIRLLSEKGCQCLFSDDECVEK